MAIPKREQDSLEELILNIAEAAGWKVTGLNDNPHGVRVKGPHWEAKRENDDGDEQRYTGWRRKDCAAFLADWILAQEAT